MANEKNLYPEQATNKYCYKHCYKHCMGRTAWHIIQVATLQKQRHEMVTQKLRYKKYDKDCQTVLSMNAKIPSVHGRPPRRHIANCTSQENLAKKHAVGETKNTTVK